MPTSRTNFKGNKVKAEIKKLWVKALNSGKYKQGRGKLKTQRGFCCLGVLCDIYKEQTGKGEWVPSNWRGASTVFKTTKLAGPERLDLPEAVRRWSGLSCKSQRLVKAPNSTKMGLASLNDTTKLGFKGIAKLIDEQL